MQKRRADQAKEREKSKARLLEAVEKAQIPDQATSSSRDLESKGICLQTTGDDSSEDDEEEEKPPGDSDDEEGKEAESFKNFVERHVVELDKRAAKQQAKEEQYIAGCSGTK